MFEEIKQQNKRVYLQSYAKSGSYKLSLEASDISHGLPWVWRRDDEEFAKAEQVAKQIYSESLLDKLEEELRKRSLDKDAPMSTVALFFALKAEHPDKYREKTADRLIGDITVNLAIPPRTYEALPEPHISIIEGESKVLEGENVEGQSQD